MKIMTFNVLHCENYITGKIDFEKFSEEILSLGADIAGLNEVRGFGLLKGYTAQTKKLAALTRMNGFFGKAINVAGVAPYGNALLSKFPLISAEAVIIPDPEVKTGDATYETRCVIKAKIAAEKEFTVLVTHMGLNLDERKNAVKTLLSLAEDERCIILGDFNCTPESEELKPLREKFICSDEKDFTFPSDKPRIKIDYIFTSPDIEVINKGTSERIVSDHLAQWIEIKEK